MALSSPFPDLPLDPFIADLRLHREDLALRWFDARRAIVFPSAAPSLLIVPPNTPLASYFAQRLKAQPVERVYLRPDDVDPYFDVFEWEPDPALSGFLASPAEMAMTGDESLGLPVNFGGAVELIAYELPAPTVDPGGTVALATFWRVLDPDALGPVPTHAYGHAVALFAHALDAEDVIVAQEDRLDAPAWNWHPGDAFVQLHRFHIDADVPPGLYRLAVGIYNREDMTRLPVVINGGAVDDHILLSLVEVTDQ